MKAAAAEMPAARSQEADTVPAEDAVGAACCAPKIV